MRNTSFFVTWPFRKIVTSYISYMQHDLCVFAFCQSYFHDSNWLLLSKLLTLHGLFSFQNLMHDITKMDQDNNSWKDAYCSLTKAYFFFFAEKVAEWAFFQTDVILRPFTIWDIQGESLYRGQNSNLYKCTKPRTERFIFPQERKKQTNKQKHHTHPIYIK